MANLGLMTQTSNYIMMRYDSDRGVLLYGDNVLQLWEM